MTRPGSGILSLMFRRGMKATGLSCSIASLGREILDLASIGRMGLEMLGVGLAVQIVVEEAKVLVGCCRMLLLLPNLSAMVATRLNHYDKTVGRKKKKNIRNERTHYEDPNTLACHPLSPVDVVTD